MIQQRMELDLIRILTVSYLVARLACRRLDVSAEFCLQRWRNRPPIVVTMDRVVPDGSLRERIDTLFPF